jgi:hypothetical protein
MTESFTLPFGAGDKKYGKGEGFSPLPSRMLILCPCENYRISAILLCLFIIPVKYFLKNFG